MTLRQRSSVERQRNSSLVLPLSYDSCTIFQLSYSQVLHTTNPVHGFVLVLYVLPRSLYFVSIDADYFSCTRKILQDNVCLYNCISIGYYFSNNVCTFINRNQMILQNLIIIMFVLKNLLNTRT